MDNYDDINKMLSNLDLKSSAMPPTKTSEQVAPKTETLPKGETVTVNTMLRDLDLFTERNNTFMNRDLTAGAGAGAGASAPAVAKPDLNERLSSRELLPTSSSYNGNNSRHNIVMESYPLSTRTISKAKNKTQ
jgi:hypothetical protein